MSSQWPAVSYETWTETCDTLHAHTQFLGKACRGARTTRAPTPARGAALDGARVGDCPAAGTRRLRIPRRGAGSADTMSWPSRRAPRAARRIPLTPDRPVGEVTRDALDAIASSSAGSTSTRSPKKSRGPCHSTRTISTPTTTPPRSPPIWRQRPRPPSCWPSSALRIVGGSTPVNAWWGSFDLAVSLFSGRPAAPPSDDFIMRNAMDAQEIAVGWWPGDPKYGKAAFYAYAHPAPEGFAAATSPRPRRTGTPHWANTS